MFDLFKKKIGESLKKIRSKVERKKPVEKVKKKSVFRKPAKIKQGFQSAKTLTRFERIKSKITEKEISEQEFENIFWDLELALMENNVAVGVIDKIKQNLEQELVHSRTGRRKVEETIKTTLSRTIREAMIE
ncbi:MAG: hypothetical protein GOU97_01465, partial [Nanoarchaeota archaeon]|nr:hypothetical protein [Nanoarchaeota archaeon]